MKKRICKRIAVFLCVVLCAAVIPFSSSAETIRGVTQNEITNPFDESTEPGDVIRFGAYPQTHVTDAETIAALDALDKNWISYGYYSGSRSFGSMKPSDFMQYADLEYDGARYRAVTFSAYRPKTTVLPTSQDSGFSLSAGYVKNQIHYFLYTPMEWIVLDTAYGLVVSKNTIDAQAFSNTLYFNSAQGVNGYTNSTGAYGSNYYSSSIRAWLNASFLETAFSAGEQTMITTLTFSGSVYTGSGYTKQEWQDKLFLLTVSDTENSEYASLAGLRGIPCTDYARCQGAVPYSGTEQSAYSTILGYDGAWWLRTAFAAKAASVIRGNGELCQGYASDTTAQMSEVHGIRGIRPAMCMNKATAHEHTYVSSVTKTPTCTEKGERTYTCSSCGFSYTEDIHASGHSTTHKIVAATCTEPGAEFDECSACGETFNEQVIPAAGHAYDSAVTKAVTCTEKGERTYTCSSCGVSYTEPIEPIGHSTTHKIVAATCTEPGAEFDECSACGETFNEQVIPAAGHAYDSAVTKAATCTEQGERTYTCSSCGVSYTEPIEPIGHVLSAVTIPATCTQSGIRYDVCSACGKRFNEIETAASGHAYDVQITMNPTCTQTGNKTYICSVCGNTYTEQIAAIPHTLTPVFIPATCIADGAQYDACSVCGGRFNLRILPALGHHYVDGVCTECGDIEFWDLTQENGEIILTGFKGSDTELYIPARINGLPVTVIDEAAFSGMDTLEFVRIPDSVRLIGANAFRGCKNLREVFLGSSVQRVRSGAFADCPLLALACVSSATCVFARDTFSGCDSRMCCIVPADSDSAGVSSVCGVRSSAYSLRQRGDKDVLAFTGKTVLFGDLDYHYWVQLAQQMPDVWYYHFESLTIDGIAPSVAADFDPAHLDPDAQSLTLKDIYMSVQLGGESVTYDRLIELLKQGEIGVVLTFDTDSGSHLTFWQKISSQIHKVYGALTKLINAIIRIFKK